MKARELMRASTVWAQAEDTDCQQAAQMMVSHDLKILPVLDEEGRLRGTVTDHDLCCRMLSEGRSLRTPVREVMSPPAQACDPDTDLKDIEASMAKHRIRWLPVVDSANKLQGLISLADLARHFESVHDEYHLAEVLESIANST